MSATVAIVSPASEETAWVVRNRVVAFVNDDLSAAALRTGLEGVDLDVKRGTIRAAARMLETDTDLRALIVDITGTDDPIDALTSLQRVCPPDVPVTVIGDATDMATYRTIVNEMGASEYISKPLTRDSVHLILRPKLAGDASALSRGGHVVALCGAQGGAGTTSIAINLAMLLAETTKGKVAILDLHLQGGETSVMLGLRPGAGLRKALEDPMLADTLFIERVAIDVTNTNGRVKLIAADEPLDAEIKITEAGVRHVIGLLRQRFNYIVIDMPVPLPSAIHPAISLARHVLVLLEAEVTGLRNAHGLRSAVVGIAGANRVFTVLNRANRPGGLPTPTIIKGLGADPDIIIPDLGRGMTEAVNSGIPALNHVKGLRRHLAPLVREIAGISTGKKNWIRRLFGR